MPATSVTLSPSTLPEQHGDRAPLAPQEIDALPHGGRVASLGVGDDDPRAGHGCRGGEQLVGRERGPGRRGLRLLEVRSSLTTAASRCGSSATGTLSAAAASASIRSACAEAVQGPGPVTAVIRRVPADTLSSPTIRTRPIWPVLGHVRAAAELAAHAVHRDHPDDVGILLAEEHHRAGMPGLGQRQELGRHRHGGEALPLTIASIARSVSWSIELGVREVEPQQVGIDLRALLHGVRAEVVLEGGVDEVRGRMGPPDRGPPVGIDPRGDRLRRGRGCPSAGGRRGA